MKNEQCVSCQLVRCSVDVAGLPVLSVLCLARLRMWRWRCGVHKRRAVFGSVSHLVGDAVTPIAAVLAAGPLLLLYGGLPP